MPYLFCHKHGQEHEASCRDSEEEYRMLGETVVVVSGRLINGPWQCDRSSCGTRLDKGDKASRVTAFPSHFADELATYDYAAERQYFQMETATVTLYGAIPPDGIADPAMLHEQH
jgi:hypothetical protein